ncbi:hypothetical protein ACPCI0_24410 [Streptomyces griseoincarnatus]
MADNSELTDLLLTVEEVRSSLHSELDAKLVQEILDIQHLLAEDRAEARKRTERAINQWVAERAAMEGNN